MSRMRDSFFKSTMPTMFCQREPQGYNFDPDVSDQTRKLKAQLLIDKRKAVLAFAKESGDAQFLQAQDRLKSAAAQHAATQNSADEAERLFYADQCITAEKALEKQIKRMEKIYDKSIKAAKKASKKAVRDKYNQLAQQHGAKKSLAQRFGFK